ncbi:single-stranded DNA-binding protein [Listeria monocytogenes]
MMNRVVLVGRLTKDPDLRYTPAGAAVATFTLAVNRPFKNTQGEQEADFINCVVWRKPAENAANFLKKGSMAGVDGRVQTRNYEDSDGKRVFVTEVVAETVQFLEPKNINAEGATSNNYQNQANYSNNNKTSSYRADTSQKSAHMQGEY